MTTTMRWAALATACALPVGVSAQHAHTTAAAPSQDASVMDEHAFVHATREGIRRFHDRSAAIAAGYRRLGPSFPGMGEHWIHPGVIVRGGVEPGTPAVLCYADVDGRARLLGAAYAFALGKDAPLPPLPGGADNWHVHQDAVDEETLLLVHPRVNASAGTRLVMTHVWTELENPAGVFAQNNWALPFLQQGHTPTVTPTRDAAQALSLLTVGTEYYERLFAAVAVPIDAERAVIAAALAVTRDRVSAWKAADAAQSVGTAEMAALEEVWRSLWQELEAGLAPHTFAKLSTWQGSSHAVMPP